MKASLILGNDNWAVKDSSLLGYTITDEDNFEPEAFDVTRASTKTRVNREGLIESVANNVASIDFLDDTEGVLLTEPQSTNLITYSEDFSNGWTKQSGIVPTYNTTETLSPDGTYNATKLIGISTSGIFKASLSVSGIVSRSVYLKSVSGTTTAIFKDPNNSSAGTANLNITNEWKRFELIGDNGTSSQGLFIDDITSDGLYIWGAQVEALPYATSYIPTNGSTVTRVQDIVNNAGDVNTFNSEEGTMFLDIDFLNFIGTKDITISDGTVANRLLIYITGSSLLKFIITTPINSVQITYNLPSTKVKVACSYKENELLLYVDGVKEAESLSVIMPSANTFNSIELKRPLGTNYFNGKIKQLKVFKTALTDAELIALTS